MRFAVTPHGGQDIDPPGSARDVTSYLSLTQPGFTFLGYRGFEDTVSLFLSRSPVTRSERGEFSRDPAVGKTAFAPVITLDAAE